MVRLVAGALLVSLAFVLPYLFYPDGLLLLKTGGWDLLNQWNADGYGLRQRPGLLGLLKTLYLAPDFVGIPYGLLLLPIPIALLLSLGRCPSIHPRRWTPTTWIPLLSTSFVVGLWLSFLRTHVWPHYLLMEAVPVALLLTWVPTGLAPGGVPRALRVGFAWSAVLLGGIIAWNITVVETVHFFHGSVEQPAIAQAHDKVLQRLRSRPPDQRFFAPGDPSFHWQLQEPIPTKGIHRVWVFDPAVSFSPSRATRLMGIATSPAERCNQFLAKPTDIIIWVESKASISLLESCLAESEDSWPEITEAWGITGSGYRVFQRRR